MSEEIKDIPKEALRRAWIMTDINECGKLIPKEILVDFNDDCNIYIINQEGKKISPTKNLKEQIKSEINNHMLSEHPHFVADENHDGLLSKEDKVLLNKLSDMRDYIVQNPYVEINSINNISKGFISDVKYEVKGDIFHIDEMIFSYRGYNYILNPINVKIGERKDEYYEEMVYITIEEELENVGREKYIISIKKEKIEDINEDEIIPIFILRRSNNKKFSAMNPFGYIYEDVLLDETEIVPEWYLLLGYNGVISRCKHRIVASEEKNIEQIVNLHFGMNHLPITDKTLVLIDTFNNKAIDLISRTYLDKSSVYRLSPTGLAISSSTEKGVNLPIELGKEFTIEFLAMKNDKENVFVNENIISLNDSEYESKFSIKVITKSLTSNNQDLYMNINGEDILLVENISKNFTMYKILYKEGNIEVRCNELVMNRIKCDIELDKISFFELSSLSIPICNVRLSKVCLNEENILPEDIHYNKGYMLPPLIRGCRKLSNNLTYIFNSIRVNYRDINLLKDEKGIPWHRGDSILLNKNEDEIISGVYNRIDSICTVLGVKSSNSLYVDNVSKLSIYDTVKIIKFNKNLFKIFKILDIDESDNSITIIDITNGDLNSVSDLNESYIYSRVFDNDVNPSIEVSDMNGKIINISQFPDNNGNVKIQLLEDATTDDIYISYILSTNYKNMIPNFNGIKDVYLDNVLCEEMDTSNIKISRDDVLVYGSNLELIETPRITEYNNNSNDINLLIKIPLEHILVNDNLTIVEDTIINTLLNSVNIKMNIANSSDMVIKTSEEEITIPKSDILTNYNLNFTSTDKTIENNNFVLRMKIKCNGEKAVILDNIKVSLNLKECKSYEKVYHKIGSNKLDDMIIINTDPNNLYVKTIFNTDANTNVLITALQHIPTIQYNKSDVTLKKIIHDNYEYLVKIDNRNMVYVTNEDRVLELPNKIKLKGSELYDR